MSKKGSKKFKSFSMETDSRIPNFSPKIFEIEKDDVSVNDNNEEIKNPDCSENQ